MMYHIEKKFTIATGHRLSKHEGLCKNIHGHNLIILVGLRAESLNDKDMIADFGDIKILVNTFLDRYDHCLLLNINNDTDLELGRILVAKDFKVTMLDFEPTAECLSKIFYTHLKEILEPVFNCELEYVTVYENENSKATYTEK